ncbi:MAG: flagellar FliJ family protein [Pseudomonadales bacterium]|jgi:flagellar export protein FliJ|nr:flagellar FliJ family protein [Pseudomonadales bacterium]
MDKLEKVLKWRVQLEKSSAGKLAQCREQREQAQAQQSELGRLELEYRQQHLEKTQTSASAYQQFLRFYHQLSQAVQAQQGVVQRLEAQESAQVQKYVICHQDRRALEKLLEQREAAHKIDAARKDRKLQRPGQTNPMV